VCMCVSSVCVCVCVCVMDAAKVTLQCFERNLWLLQSLDYGLTLSSALVLNSLVVASVLNLWQAVKDHSSDSTLS